VNTLTPFHLVTDVDDSWVCLEPEEELDSFKYDFKESRKENPVCMLQSEGLTPSVCSDPNSLCFH